MFVRNKSIVKTFYFHESIIHNNASCSEKSLLLSSHIKIYKNICLEHLFLRCLICAYFSPDSDETTFSLREALLWIIDYFGRSSWWICFSQTHSFSLHKMLIDGLEWCGLLMDYCDVFISCLDSHSDGTHSLQRIHWWASDVMLHFSKRNKLMSFLDGLRVNRFLPNFHFGMNYSFKFHMNAQRHTLQMGIQLCKKVHIEDLSDHLLREIISQSQCISQENQQVRVKRTCLN